LKENSYSSIPKNDHKKLASKKFSFPQLNLESPITKTKYHYWLKILQRKKIKEKKFVWTFFLRKKKRAFGSSSTIT